MKKIYILILSATLLGSCTKQDKWLDVKSNKADVIPTKLSDLQSLLDNDYIMVASYPIMGLYSSDNSLVTETIALTGGEAYERNAYRWEETIFDKTAVSWDWANPFKVVEYSNIVLEGVDKLNPQDNTVSYNAVKGGALFFRAFANYSLAQLFCKPYSAVTAEKDLGLPLKITADVNEKLSRSTVQETYGKILLDLKQAEQVLPTTSQYKFRATRIAARALMAKVYLCMEDYSNAKIYSDLVLSENSSLIDFTTLSGALTHPLPTFQQNTNPEIIFFAYTFTSTFSSLSNALVAPELYNSYAANDLRKTLFFRAATAGNYQFRGRYTGRSDSFCGLAVNEILLIRAECLARLGDYAGAMNDLNTLLVKRWSKNSAGNSNYVNQSAATPEEALVKVLAERRKELPFTGNLRWEDLRRLNKDPRFAKTLTRVVAGQTYTLLPNSLRYTLPIPANEIIFTGLSQNPR